MFTKVCKKIRKATYAVMGTSQVNPKKVNCTSGTGFMIAPGIISTAAHLIHINNDINKPVHTLFEVIRTPNIGQKMEKALLIAEDTESDIALLKIDNPKFNNSVILEPKKVEVGTPCGSLGFPLSQVIFTPQGKSFSLVERFQGANISAFNTYVTPSGKQIIVYETDSLMYEGSSGCPTFLVNGNVVGMQSKSLLQKPKIQSKQKSQNVQPLTRIAISISVTSMDIITFANVNNITI